ncbi:hypothetical protein CONPUDRAFT_157352 [Coniophora puteana RWD-64-598 SS2]|uniref:Uncharacterized protein n=1 Tax=Coniophora puteana (strain RWD-64-598) TaxID=741705 RepID=A0A5M3MEQ5_CONPW|nr:uncharacterized protein CONPUDRAFT_157352 [Coniophora puteana RWD-64-598 SS2]EIW77085.1 hypothetical protein CONPUDRAFT_157352 [Coniophora puteana RWD-64-598 SS2]
MASIVLDILNDIVSQVVGGFIQSIKDGMAGPVVDRISQVIANQEKILNELEDFQFKVETMDAFRLITFWTERMKYIIGDKKEIDVHDQNYQDLICALRSQTTGVIFRTDNIYKAILGSESSDITGGNALRTWHNRFYKKAVDRSNFRYFFSNYVEDIDSRITAAAFVLRQGLVLSLFTAANVQEAEYLRDRCRDRIQNMLNTASNYFPPALRFFKKSYEDSAERPLSFQLKKKGTDGDYLYMQDIGGTERMLSVGSRHQNDPSPHRFSLEHRAQALAPMQLLCDWVDNGNHRVHARLTKAVSQWGVDEDLSFTTNTGSGVVGTIRFSTHPILFKVIPAEGKDLYLVPFYEKGSKEQGKEKGKDQGEEQGEEQDEDKDKDKDKDEDKGKEAVDTYKIFRSTFVINEL